MRVSITARGFRRIDFIDRYGAACSAQESSLATEDCMWLGCNHENIDKNGKACGARMHLSRRLAAELAAILQHFADTGEILTTEEKAT